MVPPEFLGQAEFLEALRIEQKRVQRSGVACGLVRIETKRLSTEPATRQRLVEELRHALRDTDLCGWYAEAAMAGAIFIELPSESAQSTGQMLMSDLRERLQREFPDVKLRMSLSIFARMATAAGESRRLEEPEVAGRR